MPDFDEKEINKWSNKDLLDWLAQSDINNKQKPKLKDVFIKEEVTGDMLYDNGEFYSTQDIYDLLGISKIIINQFLKKLNEWNEDEVDKDESDEDTDDEELVRKLYERNEKARSNKINDNDNDIFQVNIVGRQNRLVIIDGVCKTTTIADVKQLYSNKTGVLVNKLGPMLYLSKQIKDSDTLEKLGIIRTSRLPFNVTYKVIGGSKSLNNDDIDEEKDETKENIMENNENIKKIKKKKKKKINKKNIKKKKKNVERSLDKYASHPKVKPLLTCKPDSLTFDDTKELRCKMHCGHIVGSASMFNVIKILFSEELSVNKIICPMPDCGKIWDFELCCIIADLSDDELLKYIKIYSDRNADPFSKCPTCKKQVSRPTDLTLFRVYHDNCPHYCWQCGGKWKNGPSTQICGNDDCPINDVQIALKNCTWSEIKYNNTSVTVPDFRLCPKCLTFINKNAGCKDVKCFSCGTHFCFGCLKLGNHACGGGWGGCQDGIAPSQKLI